MKSLTKINFAIILMLSASLFAQTKVTGIIMDGEYNQPLPGASVFVKGTKVGSTTDFDGKFEFTTIEKSGTIIVSYLGFETKSTIFNTTSKSLNLGKVELKPDASQLSEIVIVGKGVVDLATGRKTPVAVSTIKAEEIQAKTGTADVTQVLVNTPSVYVAGQAGGYGNSRITVRGFQQDNTAFLLNGQPINGMEDGKMYWSNWSGMSDIANVIQIQRGLGASKLAISSIGGTVNFVTKATEKREGGFLSFGVANNDYFKTTSGYNTGVMKNGFGASVILSHWQGDGYNDGTKGEGQNYFISFGYKVNEKHNFNLLLTGAPQYHDQNFSKAISTYLQYGRTYNSNWGTLNGEYRTERRNFFHKPVANLNWDFQIDDNTSLSTVLYASWGRGGGTGNYKDRTYLTPFVNGQVDFDKIYTNNVSTSNNGVGSYPKSYILRSSMNNHVWYGVVSNLKKKLLENLNLNIGLDIRSYKGDHYRQVSNYLGLNGWNESRKLFNQNNVKNLPTTITVFNTVNEGFSTNPWSSFFNTADDSQKIDYDYSETISYGGLFGQLEYAKDNFSAFFQGAVSNQTHQKTDHYDYEAAYQKSEKVSNIGYNAKAGASYIVAEQHSFFANAGYYSRQPYHDNIYLNYTNAVNPLSSNEKILGLEVGYNFKSKIFNASVNAYRTAWKDRVITSSYVQAANGTIENTPVLAGDLIYKTNQGVEQVHTGLELDFVLKPINKLDLKGFVSAGNWQYKGEVVSSLRNESLVVMKQTNEDVDGGKVGDAAQTTCGLGVKYEFLPRFSFDADWRNYAQLYANTGAIKENLLLPNYDLVDAGLSYKMLVGKDNKNSLNFRFNMNNVFSEVYLSELNSSIKTTDNISSSDPALGTYESTGKVDNGIATANQGYFGLGRTWNVTIRYNF